MDPEKRVIEYDEDLPGYVTVFVNFMNSGGQFYCLYCDKHFMRKDILDEHLQSKIHKKKWELVDSIHCSVKKANEEQYTQQEAEAAAGKSVETYAPIQRDENGKLI